MRRRSLLVTLLIVTALPGSLTSRGGLLNGAAAAGHDLTLAEQVFRATLADRHAAVIEAESAGFADRMAAVYLGDGSGADWREQVARIHDAGRVAALLLGALEWRLAENPALAQRMRNYLGATGVANGTDGMGLEMAARLQLTRPAVLAAAARRMQQDDADGGAALAAIRRMIAQNDPVSARLAAQLNRELSFARGYSAAGGFDFPTEPDDVAADLSLQLPEHVAQISAETELALYTAFAPLGAQAIERIAAARATPQSRAFRAVLDLAEADVLDQLAAESGRAAARRDKGSPL
ncbi:hypothetical protein FQV27_03555 [Paracoccus aurantiacus]|uniref:DUF2059 domain-containing protein n=1 Tax=Paracoccus aurantiacus TaxID=2599412 RepID=A0A5C6S980_9RHOB|nr:hypothetical protein [Paracoccus aurantiacus]TXB70934.1 hypothetical protein FQV27_03555 [Paracoccus aurantiacus]